MQVVLLIYLSLCIQSHARIVYLLECIKDFFVRILESFVVWVQIFLDHGGAHNDLLHEFEFKRDETKITRSIGSIPRLEYFPKRT